MCWYATKLVLYWSDLVPSIILQPSLPTANVTSCSAEAQAAVEAINNSPAACPRDVPGSRPSAQAKFKRYGLWLGRWEPEFDGIKDVEELMLHAKYVAPPPSGKGQGNELLVERLAELAKFEAVMPNNNASDDKLSPKVSSTWVTMSPRVSSTRINMHSSNDPADKQGYGSTCRRDSAISWGRKGTSWWRMTAPYRDTAY